MAKIILIDTFNGRNISRHNSLKNALKAQQKHLRAVKRANGSNSYLTYGFIYEDGSEDGTPVNQEEILETIQTIDGGYS